MECDVIYENYYAGLVLIFYLEDCVNYYLISREFDVRKLGRIARKFHSFKMARDRAFRSNSFGISATIAFAFVMPNSR
ncbi:hypothetical protein FF021_09530 [Leptospira noguchii]|nr:hypothetical protein FF021_09530 [Leptospira noguchii]